MTLTLVVHVYEQKNDMSQYHFISKKLRALKIKEREQLSRKISVE